MERVIFVEVLDRRGVVAERVRVDAFPFHIGRSYRADLVLDDPHVHPEHAVLEQCEDGAIRWRVLAPANAADARVRGIPAGGEIAAQLGQTRLRLRDRDFAVAPALAMPEHGALRRWMLSHWSALPVLAALATAASLLSSYANTPGRLPPAALATEGFGIAVVLCWAGAWALVTRILTHRGRFAAHASVAFAWALANQILMEASQWGQFFLRQIEPMASGEIALNCALAASLLFAHLSIAQVASVSRRAWIAGAIGAVAFGGLLLAARSDEDRWVSELPYWSRIQPLDPRFLSLEPAARFFEQTAALEAELADLAREPDGEER